jgi:hypothetical protein
MHLRRLGMEVSALCNLMKAASLYAESIRSTNVSFEYKNVCSNVIKTHHFLERKLKSILPDAKPIIEDAMEDDKIHYISEVVLLMSSVNTESCKDIYEELKSFIESKSE